MLTGFWWESSEGKKPLGRPRRRREDSVLTDLREIGWGDMDWIHLAQRVLVNTVINLPVPLGNS
jgi:hypothetical protein